MKNITLLIARLLMAAIFLWAGWAKLTHYDYMHGYLTSLGVPGWGFPFVILWELSGGIAIVLGLFTRPVAVLLAAFCVISALFAHTHFADQEQLINFYKNMAMTGGFLCLAIAGAGAFSLDSRLRHRWA